MIWAHKILFSTNISGIGVGLRNNLYGSLNNAQVR
jgi:hypothetical protein